MEETKEDVKLRFLKSEIDIEKESLKRYVKVLAKFDLLHLSSAGIYFGDMHQVSLKQALDVVDKSPVGKAKKSEFQFDWFMFGKWDKEKIQQSKEESDLEYYKRLNREAERVIKDCKQEVKEEMVMNYLENFIMWSNQFDSNSKLYNRLEEQECIEEALEAEALVDNIARRFNKNDDI